MFQRNKYIIVKQVKTEIPKMSIDFDKPKRRVIVNSNSQFLILQKTHDKKLNSIKT